MTATGIRDSRAKAAMSLHGGSVKSGIAQG
jgi:hypothetical protein